MIEKILQLDKELLLLVNGDGGEFMDNLMMLLTSKISFITLVVVFLILMRLIKDSSVKNLCFLFLSMAFIVLLADQTSNFFKDYFCKLRPTHNPELQDIVHIVNGYRCSLYGTMSAHAANGFGLATFMSLVYRKRWFTWVYMISFFIIAYTRIYISVHFPLDILLGTICGVFYGYVVYHLYKKYLYVLDKKS